MRVQRTNMRDSIYVNENQVKGYERKNRNGPHGYFPFSTNSYSLPFLLFSILSKKLNTWLTSKLIRLSEHSTRLARISFLL